jgi:hypothetical protein
VYFLMDCLNDFSQDVYTESLAESLLLAPHGGAEGVWASSGLINAPSGVPRSIPVSGDLSKPGRVLGRRDAGGKIVGHRSRRSSHLDPVRRSGSAPPVGCQILNLTFSVVIFSVVVQGLSIKPFLRVLDLQATGSAIYYRRSAAPTRSIRGCRCTSASLVGFKARLSPEGPCAQGVSKTCHHVHIATSLEDATPCAVAGTGNVRRSNTSPDGPRPANRCTACR